jgi:hypothetical protein
MPSSSIARTLLASIAAACLLSVISPPAAASAPAGRAGGTASFDKHTVDIKYGWLVRGPDEFDRSKTILRLYFSATDVGAKIAACETMSCADGTLANGGFVNFGSLGYNGYWLTLDGGRVQYSGGADATAFALTTKRPNHLAGKVRIDDSSFGGGKLTVDFDLPLARTFEK